MSKPFLPTEMLCTRGAIGERVIRTTHNAKKIAENTKQLDEICETAATTKNGWDVFSTKNEDDRK